MKTKKMTFNISDVDHKILKVAAMNANMTMALFIMTAVNEKRARMEYEEGKVCPHCFDSKEGHCEDCHGDCKCFDSRG